MRIIRRPLMVTVALLLANAGCVPHQSNRGTSISQPPPPVSAISSRVADFKAESDRLTQTVAQDQQALNDLRSQRDELSHGYYDQVSAIQAHLQAGTTPGNPELMATWQQAQGALTGLDDSVTKLSDLGAKLSADSAEATYLVSSVRAAFTLQGAIEADHAELADIQSQTSSNAVVLDRLLADVADDVNRQTDALTNQHHSLPGLLREIEAGELLEPGAAEPAGAAAASEDTGAAPPPKKATHAKHPAPAVAAEQASAPAIASPKTSTSPPATPHGPKPLLVVASGQSPAEYEPVLYKLAAAAIKRSPNVAMKVEGVLPSGGPPTSRALATEAVRRKAEAVARALVSFGVPREQISVGARQGAEELGGEVWVYTQ